MAYWDDDLSAVFSTTTPGSYSSTYTPNGGLATTVVVLMDQDEAEPPELDEISVISMATNIRVKSSDVPNLNFGDAFTINSVSYTVREYFNDGTGITNIKLEEN